MPVSAPFPRSLPRGRAGALPGGVSRGVSRRLLPQPPLPAHIPSAAGREEETRPRRPWQPAASWVQVINSTRLFVCFSVCLLPCLCPSALSPPSALQVPQLPCVALRSRPPHTAMEGEKPTEQEPSTGGQQPRSLSPQRQGCPCPGPALQPPPGPPAGFPGRTRGWGKPPPQRNRELGSAGWQTYVTFEAVLMSKFAPFQPPLSAPSNLFILKRVGSGGRGGWGKGAQAGGTKGTCCSALLLAGPRRTAIPPFRKPGKPSASGYFPGVNLSYSSSTPSLGHRKAASPRSAPRTAGEATSRDSGRPVFPLPGDRTKGHPLTVRVSDNPDRPGGEPGSPLGKP